MNIKANTVNLVANSENPQESNIYSCNLVEKFLFVIAKRFSEDLIRNTAADIYFDSSKSVDIKENTQNGTGKQQQTPKNYQDTLLYQKFPQNINVMDVYKTLIKHDRYDFLTNKFMANTDLNEQQNKIKKTHLRQSFSNGNISSSSVNNNNNIINNINSNNSSINFIK